VVDPVTRAVTISAPELDVSVAVEKSPLMARCRSPLVAG
jgi:hypothetical protein